MGKSAEIGTTCTDLMEAIIQALQMDTKNDVFIPTCFEVKNITAKLLFHQSPTKHSDWTVMV